MKFIPGNVHFWGFNFDFFMINQITFTYKKAILAHYVEIKLYEYILFF